MAVFAYGNTNKCNMDINEDSYMVKKMGDYIVLMIADGNGSSKGMVSPGALAISIMSDYLTHIIKPKTSIKDIYNSIEAGMFTASRCFLSINAIDEKYSNVYASLSVAVIEEISMNMVFASIGNTEIRLIRDGKINRVNKLYSEAYDLFLNNEINEEELYNHPKRAILTSALGVFNEAKVDIMMTQLLQEDILIFATDGIYRSISPQTLVEKLAKNGDDITKAVDKILNDANTEECPDNATLICCYVHDDNGVSIEREYNNKQQERYSQKPIIEDSEPDNKNTNTEGIYNPYW